MREGCLSEETDGGENEDEKKSMTSDLCVCQLQAADRLSQHVHRRRQTRREAGEVRSRPPGKLGIFSGAFPGLTACVIVFMTWLPALASSNTTFGLEVTYPKLDPGEMRLEHQLD